MSDEISKLKDHIDTKFDSLNVEMQNNNITIKEIKNDITVIKDNTLQNCTKLDTLEKKIDQLISK